VRSANRPTLRGGSWCVVGGLCHPQPPATNPISNYRIFFELARDPIITSPEKGTGSVFSDAEKATQSLFSCPSPLFSSVSSALKSPNYQPPATLGFGS